MKKILIFKPLKKLLKKNHINIIFGKLLTNRHLKKNIKFIEINDDFSFKDRKSEFKKMKKFYNKKINELTLILNKYHKHNYSRNYWEIIIGPFIDRLIFVSRYKWYIVNRNLKQIKYLSNSEIIIEENDIKINTYKEFIFTSRLDKLNAYIYSKVFNLLNTKNNNKKWY